MAFNTGFTSLQIANMALSLIGAQSTITDLNENSPEAAQIRTWFEFSRAQTLQAYDWNFARQRAALVAFTDSIDYTNFAFRYHDLTDSISIRLIWNPAGPDADAVPYSTETFSGEKTILTDMEDAVAVYTHDETDVSLFPPLFVEALAACLGYHIAFVLTGSQEIKDKMAATFQVLVRTASGVDGNEQQSKAPRDADSIRART